MSKAEEMALGFGLTIERDSSPLQRGASGISRKCLLAAVYPERNVIVLFALNIADHAQATGRPVPQLEEELVRHEIFHFRSWKENIRKGLPWNPQCPREEAAAEEFGRTEIAPDAYLGL